MMLRYSLGMPDEADRIEAAVSKALEAGERKAHIGGRSARRRWGMRCWQFGRVQITAYINTLAAIGGNALIPRGKKMPYYKVVLAGGERHERYEFAIEFGLKAADRTGHQVVFYKEHPAKTDVLQRSYQSAARGRFQVDIEPVSDDEFNGAF